MRSTGLMCIVLAMAATAALMWETEQRQVRAERAAQLAAIVAGRLASYETAASREAIQEFAADPSNDADFAAPLLTIVDNLDAYRPFLPNYVLKANSDEEGEVDDRERRSTGLSDSNNDVAPPGQVRSSRSSSSQQDARGKSYTANDRRTISAARSGIVGGKAPNAETTTLTTELGQWASWYSSVVTLCHVSVGLRGEGGIEKYTKGTAQAQHELVGTLHAAAVATSASIHSFVGDVLIASWNATHRTALGEVKACRLMLALRDAVNATPERRSTFTLHGAAVTSPAHALFAGDEKLRLFCISQSDEASWQLNALKITARRIGGLVVDSRCRETAMFHIACRPVEAIAPPVSGLATNGGVGVAFEILRDKQHDTNAMPQDEWMYVLEQNAGADSAVEEILTVAKTASQDAAGIAAVRASIEAWTHRFHAAPTAPN